MSKVEAKTAEGARFLIKGSIDLVDSDGNITDSNTLELIDKMMDAFIKSIEEI